MIIVIPVYVESSLQCMMLCQCFFADMCNINIKVILTHYVVTIVSDYVLHPNIVIVRAF